MLVFAEGANIEELCQRLQSIEIWLGHSVHTECDIATSEQIMLGEGLQQVEREESGLGDVVSVQILKPTSMPQHMNSCPSVTSPHR